MNEDDYKLTQEEVLEDLIKTHNTHCLISASERENIQNLSKDKKEILKFKSQLSYALLWYEDSQLKDFLIKKFKGFDWNTVKSKKELTDISCGYTTTPDNVIYDEDKIDIINMIVSSGRKEGLIYTDIPWTSLKSHAFDHKTAQKSYRISDYPGIMGLNKDLYVSSWLSHYMVGFGLHKIFGYQDRRHKYSDTHIKIKENFWDTVAKFNLIDPNDKVETRIFGGDGVKTKFFNELIAFETNEKYINELLKKVKWKKDVKDKSSEFSDTLYALCLYMNNTLFNLDKNGKNVAEFILNKTKKTKTNKEVVFPEWFKKYTFVNPNIMHVNKKNDLEDDYTKKRSIVDGGKKEYSLVTLILYSSFYIEKLHEAKLLSDHYSKKEKDDLKYDVKINVKIKKMVENVILKSSPEKQNQIWEEFNYLECNIYNDDMDGIFKLFASLSDEWNKKVCNDLFNKKIMNETAYQKLDMDFNFPKSCVGLFNKEKVIKVVKELKKIKGNIADNNANKNDINESFNILFFNELRLLFDNDTKPLWDMVGDTYNNKEGKKFTEVLDNLLKEKSRINKKINKKF